MSDRSTIGVLFLLGVVVALLGDAGHVDSGITEYLWDGVPTIFKSAAWFPLLVGSAVAAGGYIGSRFELPRRSRDRRDAAIGAVLILGLYFLTTILADSPQLAANGLLWAIALAIWIWWDASLGAFVFAVAASILGPAAEIVMVELGASRYLPGHDDLFGVAEWLIPLYFATGALLSGIFRAIQAPIAAASVR